MSLVGFGGGAGFDDQENPLDIGASASATGTDSSALGEGSTAGGANSVAIGSDATAAQDRSVSIGNGTSVGGNESVAIGDGALTGGAQAVAIGEQAQADVNSIAIGNLADATQGSSDGMIIIGDNAGTNQFTGTDGIAIGVGAIASTGGNQVALGKNTNAQSTGIAIGLGASGSGTGGIAIGRNASADSSTATLTGIAIGDGATINSFGGIAMGQSRTVQTAGNARIGDPEQGQTSITGLNGNIADADLQNQDLCIDIDEANTQFVIRAKDSTGTVVTGTVAYS